MPLLPQSPTTAGAPVPTSLREQVRRLERAHSAQRAGRMAVPLGLPEIDGLLPDGGLLTGALHEIEAGLAPSGRVAAHDGAALAFTAFLIGRLGPGTLAVVPPTLRSLRRTALCAGAGRLVRPGAAADGHRAARGGSVLGDGGRAAHARHRRRRRRDCAPPIPPPAAACRSRPRRTACPPCCCAPSRRRRKASVRRAGGRFSGVIRRDDTFVRARSRPLAGRAAAQPLRQALGRRDAILAPGVER